MGDPKGFLRIERRRLREARPEGARARLRAVLRAARRRDPARAGRALHGLRRARSATRAARSGTGSRTGTTSSYRDRWQDALTQLHATNNFPEFTGLICPAPCESACVLDINDDPVTIEQIELAIATRGFDEGWIDAEAAGAPHRADGRRGRLGPGRAGGRRAAQRARPQGHGLRARRGARRPAALRGAGREAREVDHRPPRDAAREGGDRLRVRRRRGPRRHGRGAAPPSRRGGDRDRLAGAARPRRPRPPSSQGVHLAMDYLYQRNRWVAREQGGPARARRRGTGSAPRASASSWSAAATPAWTASRTRCARARRTCRCSTSTPSCRRPVAWRARRGRCRRSAR